MDLTAIFSRVESIIKKSLGGRVDDYTVSTNFEEGIVDVLLFIGDVVILWRVKPDDLATKTNNELASILMDLYSWMSDGVTALNSTKEESE